MFRGPFLASKKKLNTTTSAKEILSHQGPGMQEMRTLPRPLEKRSSEATKTKEKLTLPASHNMFQNTGDYNYRRKCTTTIYNQVVLYIQDVFSVFTAGLGCAEETSPKSSSICDRKTSILVCRSILIMPHVT